MMRLLYPLSASWPEVLFRAGAQSLGRGLGGNVPLWHSQHLKAHHELAHRGRTQQRRIEVRVEVPLRMGLFVRWTLVEAHGVGKAGLEEIVEADGQPLQYISHP